MSTVFQAVRNLARPIQLDSFELYWNASKSQYYDCVSGMTWQEWVNSKYNIDGYLIKMNGDKYSVWEPDGVAVVVDTGISRNVYITDIIKDGYRYILAT